MDFCKAYDKINIPMYICSKEWIVLYRNHACKKYTSSPRVSADISKCFLDKTNTAFPEENGGFYLVGCFIRDTYKTAICFEYKGYAVIMFPTLFDFDLLFGETVREDNLIITDSFREVLDIVVVSSVENADKYNVLEKLRRHIFSYIDNYVALSMFDTENRVLGTVLQIYRFFCNSVIKTVNKAGYRVEYEFSKISDLGESIYIDTMYFTMTLSGLLLFCLSISNDKCCVVEAEHLGKSVRNVVRFTYKEPMIFGKCGKTLHDFMYLNPMEYMNFLPIEELCNSLGWELNYCVSSESELNVSVGFEIEIDNKAIFRSAGIRKTVTPEDIILSIVGNTFGFMA